MPVPQPNWVVTVGLAKEPAWGTLTVPATSFLSCPTPSFDEKQDTIFDKGLRGIRSETQAMSFGAGHSEISLPDMPLYADDSGHLFMGMLGTDTLNTYVARTGTLATVAAGATSATYTIVTGGASVTGDVFKVIDGAFSEVVRPTSVAAGVWTVPATGPGAFKYAHTGPVNVTALAEHTLTVLNTGQPPSYTLQKFDGLLTTARTLTGVYFEELTVKYVNPGKLTLAAKARGKMGSQQTKTTASYSTESFMVPWQTNITLAGVANAQVVDLEFTLKAPVDLIYGMNATQSPTAAVSDQLSCTGKMTVIPGDYTEFNYYLNNTQPALLIESDNGATQAVFQMSKVAFIDPVALSHSGNFTMLNATFEAISNATDGVGSNAPFRAVLSNFSKTTAY